MSVKKAVPPSLEGRPSLLRSLCFVCVAMGEGVVWGVEEVRGVKKHQVNMLYRSSLAKWGMPLRGIRMYSAVWEGRGAGVTARPKARAWKVLC